MERNHLRVPCLQDPVGTECQTDCPNFTYSLQLLRKLSKKQGIPPEEYSQKLHTEGDRMQNLLFALYLSNKMFRRCSKQPNKIKIL